MSHAGLGASLRIVLWQELVEPDALDIRFGLRPEVPGVKIPALELIHKTGHSEFIQFMEPCKYCGSPGVRDFFLIPICSPHQQLC